MSLIIFWLPPLSEKKKEEKIILKNVKNEALDVLKAKT
jgi:hypothetical protein